MKFETSNTERNPEEAVAYIDREGDLRIRQFAEEGHAVGLQHDGSNAYANLDWTPLNAHNRNHFFPGDSITITF